jgi:hypothetical protein
LVDEYAAALALARRVGDDGRITADDPPGPR